MIEQGLVLMGAGMGVVGLFLTTMVLVMYGSSAILRRFDKAPPKKGSSKKKPTSTGKKAGPDLAKTAVAIAAAKMHANG